MLTAFWTAQQNAPVHCCILQDSLDIHGLRTAKRSYPPLRLLITISRHGETLHYEGGYNSLHALQFQYLHPDCEVAILAGGRGNYVGALKLTN